MLREVVIARWLTFASLNLFIHLSRILGLRDAIAFLHRSHPFNRASSEDVDTVDEIEDEYTDTKHKKNKFNNKWC